MQAAGAVQVSKTGALLHPGLLHQPSSGLLLQCPQLCQLVPALCRGDGPGLCQCIDSCSCRGARLLLCCCQLRAGMPAGCSCQVWTLYAHVRPQVCGRHCLHWLLLLLRRQDMGSWQL